MATAETILRLGNMEGNAEPALNCYPETTTISTIAIESGKTRAVIAVLQSGHFINLRILEMAPKLGSIARNTSDSEEMLKQHEQVMEKLKGKQTPVEEMLLQADKVGPTKNPQVYKAMAASLGIAWKDVNATLDLRRQILKKAFEFHTNRSNCIDYFTQLNQDKKIVLVTYRYAVEDGRRLIDKLKHVVKDEPDEASYSIGLVYIWLDELQAARQEWTKGVKLIASKDRQNLNAKEYERIIQEIEAKFQAGHDPQEIRNSLLHLSSRVDKSETTESHKLHLQRLIFNLVERVTIVTELEQEIKHFLQTTTILAQPNFKHVYEEKLKLMDTFGLNNADELKSRLEKRLEARNNFETILENPFDYEDEAIEKLLNLDPGLDIASALAQIRAAKTGSLKSLFEYFEDEMKDVEVRYTSLGSSAAKESEILILKEKIKNIEDGLQNFDKDEELPKRATLSAKCQHFSELLNRAEAVAKFLSANNVLDAPGFENSYAVMLFSDLCCRAEVPNPLRDTVATRYEIQKKFDAMVENPTAFSEGHIETICNWDPTLDTREAHNKLLRLRQTARDSDLNEGNEPVKMELQRKEGETENLNELEEQILVEESYGLHSGPPQTRLEEQINAENEKQQKLEELRSEEEFRRQQAEAEQIRQQVEAEVRRQQAEAEQLRLQTEAELKRQQDEAERLRQEAEAARLRQQAELERQQFEAERIRQQAEAELMSQQLQAQLKLQQAEEQLRRQQAEIEQNRQQAEEELRRQQAEIEEKRRQAEMELEQRRAEAEFHQHQLEQQLQQQLALEEAQRQLIQEEIIRQKQELTQQRKLLELQRQKEDDERQRQLEAHERQLEADRQRQLDTLQKQKADAERIRQELELERQKVEQEGLRQLEEVARQKADEEERMRQLEEDQRRINDERQRQLEELERHKAEAEQKRQLEDLERQRLREAELLRQLEIDAENERLRQLRQANLDRELQNKVLEQQLELELEQKRHELEQLDLERQKALDAERQKIEIEKKRQTELENQRKAEEQKRLALEEQRRQALEIQRQREIQIQLELEAQQRFDAEEKRKAAEREALEAQKLREEHLEHLFKTLDFPLPENLDTARSDLRDFQKFEAIVEEMDNPPLELIEKMYEKKNKILQCLQFYELIQKPDRILYIREIMELERNIFQSTTITEVIRQEVLLPPNGNAPTQENQRREPAVSQEPNNFAYAEPIADYFSAVSDHEVQTIFEQSTMQTQTSERDAKIIANSETQTLTEKSPEPIVLVMQQPAKLLSTIQTQTPTLPEPEVEVSEKSVQSDMPKTSEVNAAGDLGNLRPESPAKLLLTSETQTSVKSESPELISKKRILTCKESETTYETTGTNQEPKLQFDSITQTHEASPQLLRNFSTQTNVQEPDNKFQNDQASEDRRPSVLELVNALNSQINTENITPTNQKQAPPRRRLSNEWREVKVKPTEEDSNRIPAELKSPKSVVTTTKRFFDNFEETVTTRVDYPEEANEISAKNRSYETFPRKKVKDYRKMFETETKEERETQIQPHSPRTVPIQVEFPARGKVGHFRQLFESNPDDTPVSPAGPAYRISSVRETSKYDSVSRNFQTNYSEHVSCHGVDSPVISPVYPAFLDSRPESAASNSNYAAGIRRPTKFVPAKFTESDYESDYESFKIEPIWIPPSSRQNRPMSAYEFRPTTFTAKTWDEPRPKSTNLEKPVPPPKPIAKPIAQKPVPPPKPTRKTAEPEKITTDQMNFKVAEPISETLQKHKQLTTTMTKTEECKFYLRPIESPVEHDEELQVRRSVSPTKYVSVTSTPIQFIRARTDSPQVGKFYNKETFREERSWKSYDREKSEAFEFGHYSKHLESTTAECGVDRPKSTEFHKNVEQGRRDGTQSADIFHFGNAETFSERTAASTKDSVHHEIKIAKEGDKLQK